MTANEHWRYKGYDALMSILRGTLKQNFQECKTFNHVNKDFLDNTTLDIVRMPNGVNVDFINATLFSAKESILISVHGASASQLEILSNTIKSIQDTGVLQHKTSYNGHNEFKLGYSNAEQTGKAIADTLHSTLSAPQNA